MSDRSPLRAVALLIAGIAVGLIGGYVVWGRGAAAPVETTAATTTPGAAASPTPAPGREFSEQAVTPKVPPAADAAGTTAAPGATASADRGTRTPDRDAATPPKAAGAASAGTLVVRSTPAGAGVTLNGRWRGRTPLTLDALPFRRYDVRVVQPGFTAVTEAVVLSAETPARSLTLQLVPQAAASEAKPAAPRDAAVAPPRATPRPAPSRDQASGTVYTGSIYVDSRPRGARVTVDGKPLGVTPLRVPDIRIGTHVVRLELADHRWWSTTTRVTAGQEQRVTGSLERIQ